jgi:hypothetical protein
MPKVVEYWSIGVVGKKQDDKTLNHENTKPEKHEKEDSRIFS